MENTNTASRLSRLVNWARQHKAVVYVGATSIVLLTSVGVGALLYFHHSAKITPTPSVKKNPPLAVTATPEPKFYSPLTGLPVADDAATKNATTAIMIENSPDARPQSGIKSAGIVFEAIAEGGITRFLTVFQNAKPQLIGPVRSVRAYYVDWVTPFDASVAHVGGSLFGLQQVRNGHYRDIDQFFNPGAYWRATDRYAPHNVYTSFARLDALNAQKGYKTSSVAGFARKDPAPSKTPNATKVSINISGPLYNSTYAYDAASNTYKRSQAGAPHLDREAGQIAPTVVVAMRVNMSLVKEDGWREQITTIGDGKATVFQDGTATDVTWHKPNRGTQISFTDSTGAPFALSRGQTWIAAVPNSNGGSVSWK